MFRFILLYSFLFLSANVFSQQINVENSQEVKRLLPERILVHSDNDFYIAGQIMWYKIYVVNDQSLKLQSLSKTAYAQLVGKDGNIAFQTKIQLQEGTGSGSFLIPDDIRSGVYELIVYTNWMKNRPEAFFRKNIFIVNTQKVFDTTAFNIIPDTDFSERMQNPATSKNLIPNSFTGSASAQPNIQLQLNKQYYKQRSPVNLKIRTLSGDVDSTANLSVAVYKLNNLSRPHEEGKSVGSSPGTFADDNIEKINLPEMEGYLVKVRATGVADESAVKGVPVIVSLTGKLTDVKYGETDENGIAWFNFKNVYGDAQLFLKTTPEFENKVNLQVLSSFLRPQVNDMPEGVLRESDLEVLEELHNDMIVNRTYDSSQFSGNNFLPENVDSFSFYGKPDKTYLLDNYKRFVTMEEVLREYVMEVSVRIRKKDFYLLVLSLQSVDLNKFMMVDQVMDDDGPLILMDGIPITPNELMKYDPLKVRKLEVIADKYLVGKRPYDGVLSFTTYQGRFEGLELGRKELLADEQGWQYQRKFFVPAYTDPTVKNNRLPDFRQLLYWEPNLKLGNSQPGELSFFTGDVTGEFIVEVKGVTGNGKMVNNTLRFNVEK